MESGLPVFSGVHAISIIPLTPKWGRPKFRGYNICALVAFTFIRGQRVIEANAVKRKREVVMSEVKLSLVRKYNAKLTTNLLIGWFSEDTEWDLYSHVWTRVGLTSSLLGFCCVDNLPCRFLKLLCNSIF